MVTLPRAILFLSSTHDDPERVVRQRSLQRLGFVPRRAHPHISLFVGEQDHRHGLRTDRLDHRVRRCDEKTISMVKYLVERGFTVFMISYSVHAELCTYPTGSGDCEESGEIEPQPQSLRQINSHVVKSNNPASEAVRREREEDWH